MRYNITIKVPTLDGIPHCTGCSMLLVTRFGTERMCRLYTDAFGGRDPEYLGYYENDVTKPIKPHPKCLERLRVR